MEALIKKLQEQALAAKTLGDKLQTTKADLFGDSPCDPTIQNCVYDMQCSLRGLAYQMEYIMDMFQNHLQGHLPAVKSTEQLQRAVDVLGLDGEYQVMKPTIYAKKNGAFIVS